MVKIELPLKDLEIAHFKQDKLKKPPKENNDYCDFLLARPNKDKIGRL